MKTIEQLLTPVSDEQPCGEDLDESLEFDTLRSAFDVNFPIDSGVSPVADGEKGPLPVDWSDLFDQIETLCDKTKDIYLAVSYARCGIVRGDPDIVEQGLLFAARLLEEQWDDVHPLVDDPGGRLRGALFEDLARRGAFSMPLLGTSATPMSDGSKVECLGMPLVIGKRGSLKGEQLVDVHAKGSVSDHYAEVRGTLDELDEEAKGATATLLASLRNSTDRIETALRAHYTEAVPDFTTVKDRLKLVEEAYLVLAGLLGAPSDDDGNEGEYVDASGDAPSASKTSFGGAVKSREDVLKALNAIEQYYAQAEPGHPMRLAMGRLRSWVGKDFMEILEDIAPGSLDDVKSVLLERRDVE